MAKNKLLWKAKPEPSDYEAASAFLSLVFPTPRVKALVRALRAAPITQRSAKDLLRASGLPLLPQSEASVKNDLKKIAKGKPLAPILLVRGNLSLGVPLIVADGYHRICAVCHFDEFAPVSSQMVDS
jgi:hypothetical protein